MSSVLNTLESGGGRRATGLVIIRAAERIGCDRAVLDAILQVESGGEPFDRRGRLIILPEMHVFWRELPKKLRTRARAVGLATPKWSRRNYAGLGGTGSDKRWLRMREMVAIDETAALRSASYGAPQIMGFNHKLCGFPTVTAFVLALATSEDDQQEAFISFLEGVGLAEDLRERDFRAIARRYNGSGQVAHYAGLMEAAFKRITGAAPSRSAGRERALRLGSEGYRVRALQERLIELGYHVQPDGDFGPATRRAVVAFQADHGLTSDGIVGPATDEALNRAVAINKQPGNSRENITVSDLRRQGSQTVKQADRLTIGGGIAAAGGVVAEAVDQIDDAAGDGTIGETVSMITEVSWMARPLLDFIADHKWLFIIGLAAGAIFIASRIKKRRLSDAQSWRHVG